MCDGGLSDGPVGVQHLESETSRASCTMIVILIAAAVHRNCQGFSIRNVSEKLMTK